MGCPTLMAGDFSEVLAPKERKGNSALTRSIEDFRDFVHSSQLLDLPLIGREFS